MHFKLYISIYLEDIFGSRLDIAEERISELSSEYIIKNLEQGVKNVENTKQREETEKV